MATTTDREKLIDRLGRDAFITTFIVSNRFTEDLEQCCRAEGISHALYAALWVLCLAEAPDGLPMGALADGLLTRGRGHDPTRRSSRQTATRYPQAVERRPEGGARQRHDPGPEVFQRLTAEIKALHRRQWATLDTDELRQLIHLLNKALWAGEPATANPVGP